MTPLISLPRSTPEALGIASGAVLAFAEAAEQRACGLHSFMLVRHGQVAAAGAWAPYALDRPHMLFSLSKSFNSTAVGLAATEGRLSLEDPVLSFFPEEAPSRPRGYWPSVRVRHLLTMSTGHEQDTMQKLSRKNLSNWVRGILEQPVKREPGTHFVYNNGASYLLSAIVQKVTGMTVRDYLQPRLFEPLGIALPDWELSPEGICCGGWGLSLRTEAIARFGQLYLQKGMWNGQRLLPESWVAEATRPHLYNPEAKDPDWGQGYGYQFWCCRHGIYRGDGAFGQYCLVMPEHDAVMAITGGMPNLQLALDLVWEHLLPAMKAAPLAADPAAHGELERRLAGLALPPQEGAPGSPRAAQVSGRTYRFEPKRPGTKAVTCSFEGSEGRIVLEDARGEHILVGTHGAWRWDTSAWSEYAPENAVAVSGAWTAGDTYTMQVCCHETPFLYTLTFRFTGNRLSLNLKRNVAFGPTQSRSIVGRAD